MAEWIMAVDAMGGDNAPGAVCEGAVLALREMPDIRVKLFGREEEIRACLPEHQDVADRLEVVDARDVIDMHEAPMMAVRRKTESSMVKAMLALKNGEADAFVSAGSTGAVLAGGMTRVGRIRGIERPAIATVVPGSRRPFILVDSGANVDCQPGYLVQFGMMGAVYMEKVMGAKDVSVGLVNIGVEDTKGNAMSKEAYRLMREQEVFSFAGNIEAREVPTGDVQVIACDGFDGNLLLKYTEGLSSALFSMIKRGLTSGARAKIGALLVKPVFKNIKGSMDYEKYGGAPLLGVNGAIIKAHGSSGGEAIMNAVRQARDMLKKDVPGQIRAGVEKMSDTMNEEA